jgi:NADH-quinone oxidoreductase subunit M
MQGSLTEKVSGFRDLNAREILAVTPLIVLIFALGIYPKPVIDIINPAVRATMHDIGQTDPQPQQAALHSTDGGHK